MNKAVTLAATQQILSDNSSDVENNKARDGGYFSNNC